MRAIRSSWRDVTFLSAACAVATAITVAAVQAAANNALDAAPEISAVNPEQDAGTNAAWRTNSAPDIAKSLPAEENDATPQLAASDRSTLADRFKTAYGFLLKADEARGKDQWAEAARFYKDALSAYRKLAEEFPEWQPGIGRFRISYCENQAREMLKKTGGPLPANEPAPGDSDPAGFASATGARPTVADIAATARAFLQDGKGQEARNILLDGLRLDQDDRAIRLLIAAAQCQSGNFADATHILDTLIEEQPDDTYAHVILGVACLGLGRPDDARRELDLALKHNPRISQAHYNLAQALLLLSPPDPDSAREHYRKSVELGAPEDKTLEERLHLTTPPPGADTEPVVPTQPASIED
ncbi:MAG: tetratricopeptide repeat protein [Verrucomicrobiota bacterium]|nr:tetratricopeptide repeat protein [Verrucomicrobiota bacterium]